MACYHPLTLAPLDVGGPERHVPCGQCVGCRLERSREWAVRCVHEAQMHERNCVVTLTYKPECLPGGGALRYRDFQLFMKRLRLEFPGSRFLCAGEYGKKDWRPHFHACLFGVDFEDKVYFKKSRSGTKLYTSKRLEELWSCGQVLVGELDFQSAGYIARYCVKDDINKYWTKGAVARVDLDTGEVTEVPREFSRSSNGGRIRTGGIGKLWLDCFFSDVYPHGKVVSNGAEFDAPRYYDKVFSKAMPGEIDKLKDSRRRSSWKRLEDSRPKRRKAREVVAKARLALSQRS